MRHSATGPGLRAAVRAALVLLAGTGVLLLPEPAAAVAGLVLLYAFAAVAVVSGAMNLVSALRVREVAGWLLPASLVALTLGLAAFAAPAGLGSALTHGLGGGIVVAGGLGVLSALRRGRALRPGGAHAGAR